MPRQPRYFLANIPQHVIARGVDRQPVFFTTEDYALYLRALRGAAMDSRCQVHAYVLMTNHVHLLVTPERDRSLPLMMQAMGRAYVQRLNARCQRTGTLWEGRYKAMDDPLLTPHPDYLGLGADPVARRRAYRALFSDALSEELLTRLRKNTNACVVIGDDRFKKQLAKLLGRAVPSGKRGRPKKARG